MTHELTRTFCSKIDYACKLDHFLDFNFFSLSFDLAIKVSNHCFVTIEYVKYFRELLGDLKYL
jgi:hypothetical protein